MKQRKALFFDRDGIVNMRIMCGYVTHIDEFEFLPEFFSVFRQIKDAGYVAILITNQQGVGKGLMSNSDLLAIHDYMQRELLHNTGYEFDDIYACTALASSPNSCRKPSPTMLLEAMEKWNIDPAVSWMVGDTLTDAQAAQAAGIPSILVGSFAHPSELPTQHVFSSLRDFETRGLPFVVGA